RDRARSCTQAPFTQTPKRLNDPFRLAGEDEIELFSVRRQILTHCFRRPPAALVQWPVKVVDRLIVPARLGMTQQGQASHAVFSSTIAPRRCLTRSTATSSGTRDTRTPGGNAVSRRDGIAADRITNTPRSPWRRIRR